jgi:spore maturation protein CgeB
MEGKKVLIVGPTFYGYNQSVERAFNILGYQTKVLNFLDADVEGLKEKITYHLSKSKPGFFEKKRIRYNAYFKKEYDAYQPDILFLIKGSILQPQTVEYARKKCPVILWMMDSIYLNHTSYILRNVVDHIFLFEETEIPKLAAEGIKAHFLPLALDESVYYPIEKEKDIDLLFVGALYPNRIELLDKIINAFPEKKIKIYGRYFSPLRQPLKYLFRKDKHVYTNKNLPPNELNKLYAKSKVCLNIHHKQSIVGVNQRFFEILGSKSLQITDFKKFIGDNFTENDLLWYRDEKELMKKLELSFVEGTPKNEMVENGYKKVLEGHTFVKRVQSLLKTVGIE